MRQFLGAICSLGFFYDINNNGNVSSWFEEEVPTEDRSTQNGPGEVQIVRMHAPQLATIDAWIKAQGEQISRPEAIRRLVELGLAGTVGRRAKRLAGSPKPSELANTAIDYLADKSAPTEERASRKRRLIKGPHEFQDARVDNKARK